MRSFFLKLRLFSCNCFCRTGQQSLHGMVLYPSYYNLLNIESVSGLNTIAKSSILLKAFRSSSTTVKGLSKLVEVNDEKGEENQSKVIYYGSLVSKIKGVKVFSCTTSLCGIAFQPWIVQKILSGENVTIGVVLGTLVGFFTFVTPLLLHLFTKKYVTKITYSSETDTYTATTLSFFLQKVNVTFKAEDVSVPNLMPMFATMCIKGRPVMVNSDCFLEVKHYIRMMGYDKPIDLKLNTPSVGLEDTIEKTRKKKVVSFK